MGELQYRMTLLRRLFLSKDTPPGGMRWIVCTCKYACVCIFIVLGLQKTTAQSVIRLDQCGFSYIDPQNANVSDMPMRDSMVYTEFFNEDSLLKAFYVDINAFSGQQVDRTKVFAILPDSSKQLLGELAFGNCTDCVEGFALVHDGALQTQNVSDRATMDMWLQAFNHPPFKLTGNLQTLRGVGRIGGQIPFCAIGWQVEYSVFNTPNNSSTEFTTHILCAETIASCPITTSAQLDCPKDSLYLRAMLPSECFSNQSKVRWTNGNGFEANATETALALTGNLGMYYLTVEDKGCTKKDSVLVENPPFTVAGEDQEVCQGATVALAGAGGIRHFWETPSTGIVEDSLITLANIQANQAGNYILHAFDAIGCEDTDTVQIVVNVPPEPEIAFQPPCLGDTLIINILNDSVFAQVSWTNPQGAMLNPPIVQNFQASDAGTYTLNATDSKGCTIQTAVEINGSEPPELQIIIEESCDSSRVYLAPEEYQYVWQTGATGNVFAIATGGTYVVTVTDPIGCSSIAEVELPQPDGPGIEVKVTQPFCPGDLGAIQLIADNPDRPLIFSIDGGATYSFETKFKDLPYGDYQIIAQDDLGCIQEIPIRILAPDSMGVALNIDSLEVRPGTPVSLVASTLGNIRLYQWLPEEIDTGTSSTDFEATTNLNVRIIVEDDRGCRAVDGFFLEIVLGEVYTPNAFSPNNDGANDRFTLFSDNGSGEILESLRIFDRWGNLLFEKNEVGLNDESQGWDGSYRGKPAKPGVYTYLAIVRFGNGTRKTFAGDVTLLR